VKLPWCLVVLSVTLPVVVSGSFIFHYLVAKYFLIVNSSLVFVVLLCLIGLLNIGILYF
jgi:hypothetical protein